jgi:hypothetical protein
MSYFIYTYRIYFESERCAVTEIFMFSTNEFPARRLLTLSWRGKRPFVPYFTYSHFYISLYISVLYLIFILIYFVLQLASLASVTAFRSDHLRINPWSDFLNAVMPFVDAPISSDDVAVVLLWTTKVHFAVSVPHRYCY